MWHAPRRHYVLASKSEQDDQKRALWAQEALDGEFKPWWVFELVGRPAPKTEHYTIFSDKGSSRCIESTREGLSDRDVELAWALLFSEAQDERLTLARRSIPGLTIHGSKWEFERLSRFPELRVLFIRAMRDEAARVHAEIAKSRFYLLFRMLEE